MKFKPFEPITKDNLHIKDCLVLPIAKSTPYNIDIIPFFGDNKTQKVSIYSNRGNNPVYSPSYVDNKALQIELDVLGTQHVVDLTTLVGNITYAEAVEKHPKVAEHLDKHYNADLIDRANNMLQDRKNTYAAKIQKLYDELLQVYTDLGYKTDAKNLSEVNDLLYCEAESFLRGMEDRINKKANAKNLKLYKALQTLRGKDIISCSE